MFDQQVPAMDVGLNDEKFSYVTSPAAFRTLVHAAINVLPQRENILAALQLQMYWRIASYKSDSSSLHSISRRDVRSIPEVSLRS